MITSRPEYSGLFIGEKIMAGKKEKATSVVKADGYRETFTNESTNGPGCATLSAEQLYLDDPIAKRIVDVIPEEMVTSGFGIDGLKDEKAFRSEWDGMRNNEKLICALSWGSLYGGALIVAIIRDGRSLTSPAVTGRGRLENLRVYDRNRVRVGKREENARNPRYGEPVTYLITPDGGKQYEVHYTRCHPVDGERVTAAERKKNQGWGGTVLSKGVIEAIEDYNYCHMLATKLLRRKQQAVWRAKGLAALCDDKEGEYAARLRLAQVGENSGVDSPVGIDADDEDYTVLNSDIGGVDAFLDKKFDRIVSASGIHEIILKNKNVGGVSASQNTALETFYKQVERKRNEDYRPILEWLIPFMIDAEEWSIRFEPLSVPSEKDTAETLNKNVNSLKLLIDSQAIDTDEARDTLEAMSDIFKLKKGAPVITQAETEPGVTESTQEESSNASE